MEKEVIINFKHQQDFKMNEDYDKDLSLSKLSPSSSTVRMDACCKD